MSGDYFTGCPKTVIWVGCGLAAWVAVTVVVLVMRWIA